MHIGSMQFIFKATLTFLVMVIGLVLLSISVEQTTARFGSVGWIHWLVGLGLFAIGVIAVWATVITGLDRRALRAHRVDPEGPLEDGQIVALTGRVRVQGEPLKAPFSGTPCACFNYRVSGLRSSSDNGTRGQLCLLGFEITPAVLECGARRFNLLAVPDVDTDLREMSTGGPWGEMGLARIKGAAETETSADEPDAQGALSEARTHTRAPRAVHRFVAPTRSSSINISVVEDHVPVDKPVTVLASYASLAQGLDGRRWGGMKVFLNGIDERLVVLDHEWRKGLRIGLPMLVGGLALLTLASWLPA